MTWKFSDVSPPAGDYYLECQVTDKGGTTDWGSPEKVYFNSDGDAHFNASTKLIEHFGEPDYSYDYAPYKISPTLGQAYNIKYRTVNNGTPTAWTVASLFKGFIQATPNLRKGTDYEDYYSKLTDADKCKFLTHFERPTKWYGYPFSLAFTGLQDSFCRHAYYAYDNNDSIITGGGVDLPGDSRDPFVHLNVDDLDVNQHYIISSVAYNPISGNETTEQITIDCEQPPCNPFYVRWVNEFGGYDYWMFQDPNFSVSRTEGLRTTKNEWFYQNATGATQPSDVEINDTVTVGSGGLTYQKLLGIQGILRTSRNPQWLQNVATKKWVDLEIVNEDIPANPKQDGLAECSIEFAFPKIYTR